MFIEALFLIVKLGNKEECPSVDGWINGGTSKQWNIIQC